MHDNSHVIIHVLANVSQERSSNNRNNAKGNASIVYVRIRVGVSHSTSQNDVVVDSDIAVHTWQVEDLVEERNSREFCGSFDSISREDTVLNLIKVRITSGSFRSGGIGRTYASCCDFEFQRRDELVVEDVVVSGVTNGTSNDTD